MLNQYRFLLCSLLSVFLVISAGDLYAKKKRKAGEPAEKINVKIEQVITKKFPHVEVFASVTSGHEPVLSLVRGNFTAAVDGVSVTSKMDVSGFQYSDEGVSYSLLISGNGMMEGEAIEAQLKAAIVLLETLRDSDRLSVYVFAEEVKTVFEFKKKDGKLIEEITKIEVLGGNPRLYDALVYLARRTDSADNKRKVILVMSDGRESGSRYNWDQLFKVLDEINVPVYSIGLKIMDGQNLYRISKISDHTGGGYIYSDKLSGVSDVMGMISNQILQGYIIKFTVDSIPADDQLHQLQIKAVVKEQDGSFFKNFVAEKVPVSLIVIIVISVVSLIILVVFIIVYILQLRKTRREMGITKRKCSVCGNRMKDDWDECMFCKYEPVKKKRWFKKRK